MSSFGPAGSSQALCVFSQLWCEERRFEREEAQLSSGRQKRTLKKLQNGIRASENCILREFVSVTDKRTTQISALQAQEVADIHTVPFWQTEVPLCPDLPILQKENQHNLINHLPKSSLLLFSL